MRSSRRVLAVIGLAASVSAVALTAPRPHIPRQVALTTTSAAIPSFDELAEWNSAKTQLADEKAATSAFYAAIAERATAVKAAANRNARHAISTTKTYIPHPPPPAAPVGSIQEAICNAFGPYCSKALRVAKCESNFHPTATNGQYRGLFQIGVVTHSKLISEHRDPPTLEFPEGRSWNASDMYDVGRNIIIALQLSGGGRNWGPWECQ